MSFYLFILFFGTALNNAQLTHPSTSAIHDSKRVYTEHEHFKHMK